MTATHISLELILKRAHQYIDVQEYGRAKVLLELIQSVIPEQPDCLKAMGVIAFNVKEMHIALQFFERALTALRALPHINEINPIHAEYLSSLGLTLYHLGRLAEALVYLKTSLKLNDNDVVKNWYQQLLQLAVQASSLCEAQLAQDLKNHMEFTHSLSALVQKKAGTTKKQRKITKLPEKIENQLRILSGQKNKKAYEQAKKICEEWIKILPYNPILTHYFGVILYYLDEHQLAYQWVQRAINTQPTNPKLYNTLGVIGRHILTSSIVIPAFKKALELSPNYFDPHMNLANLLRDEGRYEEALSWYERALELNTQSFELYNNLGLVYKKLLCHDQAIAYCTKALELNPHYPLAYLNIAACYEEQMQREEAVKNYQRAYEYNNDLIDVLCPLIYNLAFMCNWQEIEQKQYIQTLKKVIDTNAKLEYIPFVLLALPEVTPSQIRRASEIYAKKVFSKFLVQRPELNFNFLTRQRKDKLRVGFVSVDFRDHAVATFIEPLFQLYDKNRFEFIAYYALEQRDHITQRLASYVDGWRNVANLPWRTIVQMIYQDEIDVLIDLNGLTSFTRLDLFAGKPAPVQATWLGYPGTTGLETMDYLIVDRHTCPPEQEQFYTEKIWHLPDCHSVYRPCVRQPERRFTPELAVQPTPALKNGYITFGMFNALYKANPRVFKVWAEILKRVPKSLLFVEAPHLDPEKDQVNRDNFIGQFTALGIAPERIQLTNRDSKNQYVLYHHVDIALDPFPYNGGTTSCDTLWMGVPLITLAGDRLMGRAGLSWLTYIGHPEWIAQTEAEYVEKAVQLASDVNVLNTIRLGLRQDVERSPVMDYPRFVRNMENAFQGMFEKWWEASGLSQ